MALTGTLRDFGVAEILQLIGTQKKTGLLTVEDEKRKAEIEFSDGMVVGAKGGEDAVSIEERFVLSGIITREQLETAKRRAQETLKPLFSLLVGENYADPVMLRDTVNRHIAEVVYEIFDWKSGTYAFNQQFIQWDKQIVRPIPAESIMMEGLRIVDEGPGVRKLLPSLDDIYDKGDPTDAHLKQLDAESKQLLELVDGVKKLSDVIIASHQPKFDAMKRLSWMRMNRYIIRKSEPDGSNSNGVAIKEARPRQYLTNVTSIAFYVLLAVVGILLALRVGGSLWQFAAPLSKTDSTLSTADMLGEARINRVRNALEAYRLRHGAYPNDLEALVSEKLIFNGDIKPLGGAATPYKTLDSGLKYLLGVEAAAPIIEEKNQ